jgi:hypothetical protein
VLTGYSIWVIETRVSPGSACFAGSSWDFSKALFLPPTLGTHRVLGDLSGEVSNKVRTNVMALCRVEGGGDSLRCLGFFTPGQEVTSVL